MWRPIACAVSLSLVLLGSGCTSAQDSSRPPTASAGASYELPPGGGLDYQLGGAYTPPSGTRIVVRDSTAPAAEGIYSICYINGFQSQPGEASVWAGLLLTDEQGPIADPDWPDEFLLDTSTASNRAAIAERMRTVIEGCAGAGYDAVEFDNLDSYLRAEGRLSTTDNLELARLLIDIAHESGLAAGQKNALEVAQDGVAAGFDYAVTEECGVYDECAEYLAAYDIVLNIEYTGEGAYDEMCATGILPLQSVRRDIDLTTPDSPDYVFQRCG